MNYLTVFIYYVSLQEYVIQLPYASMAIMLKLTIRERLISS
uniref:Uncharacterized protein n=1 Tax=Heterorhabditis bacteriophora TaxID=37862 RepID=A0A1I7WBI2_HETBA